MKAFIAVEVLPTEAGAKAAAEPARREAMASFIILEQTGVRENDQIL